MRTIKMGFVSILVLVVIVFTACESVTSGDSVSDLKSEVIDAELAKGSQWVEKVSGGGKNVGEDDIIEWLSINAMNDTEGNASGMYEYANEGIQDWRYHGSIDCLAVSDDGTRAVAIGPVTLSQGPDAPALGTRVGFYIQDNGNGKKQDSAVAFFAGPANCDVLIDNNVVGRPTSGNYNIATR